MCDVRRSAPRTGLLVGLGLRRGLCALGVLVLGLGACGPWATKNDPIVCNTVAKIRILPHPSGRERPAGVIMAMCDGRAVYEAECDKVELRAAEQGATDVFCNDKHVVRALRRATTP